MQGLLSLVVYIVVLAILVWLALWLLRQFPLPDPLGRIAYAAVIILAVLVFVSLLLGLLGGPDLGLPRFR